MTKRLSGQLLAGINVWTRKLLGHIFQQWPERLFIFLLICLDCPGIVRRCLSRVLAGFKYARAFLVEPVHFFEEQITTTYYSATDML